MISLSEAYTHSPSLTFSEFIWHNRGIMSPGTQAIWAGAPTTPFAAVWILYVCTPAGWDNPPRPRRSRSLPPPAGTTSRLAVRLWPAPVPEASAFKGRAHEKEFQRDETFKYGFVVVQFPPCPSLSGWISKDGGFFASWKPKTRHYF